MIAVFQDDPLLEFPEPDTLQEAYETTLCRVEDNEAEGWEGKKAGAAMARGV
jgi:hypothetical protein